MGFPQWSKETILKVTTLVFSILGIILGVSMALSGVKVSETALEWIGIWGELFLRLLDTAVLPLVVSLIISGIAKLDTGSGSRTFCSGLIFLLCCMVLSVAAGVFLMAVIKPTGSTSISDAEVESEASHSKSDVFLDLLRNLCPSNIVGTCIERTQTQYVTKGNTTEKVLGTASGANLPGVAVISILIAVCARMNMEVSAPVVHLAEAGAYISLQVIRLVLWCAPVGILSLLLHSLLEPSNDLVEMFKLLGLFAATVVLGELLLILLIIPALMALLTFSNPYKYLMDFTDAFLFAIAPPSSAAAIPYIFSACDQRGIPSPVYSFSVPFFNTFCKAGSAMYTVMSIIFLSAITSTVLSAADYVILSLVTIVLSTSIASVPSGSILALIIICNSLSIPSEEGIAMLFVAEVVLNRVRVVGNVMTMCYGTIIMHHWSMRQKSDGSDKEEGLSQPKKPKPPNESTPLVR